MEWNDSRKVAPKHFTCVLVHDPDGVIRLAYYNEAGSISKGLALPNNHGAAVWYFEGATPGMVSYETTCKILHWMPLPDPPKDVKTPNTSTKACHRDSCAWVLSQNCDCNCDGIADSVTSDGVSDEQIEDWKEATQLANPLNDTLEVPTKQWLSKK